MSGGNALLVLLMLINGMATSVINKYLVSGLRIKSKFFILSMQTLVTVVILLLLNLFVLKYKVVLDMPMLQEWTLISLSLIMMIYSGLQANTHLPISLFTILKNGTIPIIALHDWLFSNYRISWLSFVSFALIVLSSALGTVSDSEQTKKSSDDMPSQPPEISFMGLGWILVNCISTASYSIRMNKTIKAYNTESIMASLYINALALPLLTVFSLGELLSFDAPLNYLGIISFSGILSCMISVSTSWAASIFSSTTISMITALNKIPISISGVVLGLEELGSIWKWTSIVLGMISALCYIISRN